MALDGGDRNAHTLLIMLGHITDGAIADVTVVDQDFNVCRSAGAAQNRGLARQKLKAVTINNSPKF